MQAPKKVKLCGHTLTIEYFTTTDAGRELGSHNYTENKITVQTGMHHDQERATVLHEILHGICATYGLRREVTKELEERICTVFEAGLYQVLVDNPKLVKYLLEKE